jgi:hypothetical protein
MRVVWGACPERAQHSRCGEVYDHVADLAGSRETGRGSVRTGVVTQRTIVGADGVAVELVDLCLGLKHNQLLTYKTGSSKLVRKYRLIWCGHVVLICDDWLVSWDGARYRSCCISGE